MSNHRTIGQPVPADLLAELRTAAQRLGEHAFLDELGLSADTAARALAGYRVHAGTVAAVRLFLERRRRAA